MPAARRSRRWTSAGRGFDTSLDSLLADDDTDVLVELIGGDTTARDIVATALAAGRPVVTANKALLAEHGNELFAAAQAQQTALGFEASVAGGIPILGTLRNGLAANRIDALVGIVNGTSNYILTAMAQAGRSFDDALAEAQRLGYAEADPSFDIDGIDAVQKLAILAMLAFDTRIEPQRVHVEGIAQVDAEDMRHARELGFAIKHLAIARLRPNGLEARVHLALVPESTQLAQVAGVMNAVLAHGDAVGPTLLVGAGAGGPPTASAVVADLIELARGTLPAPMPAGRALHHLPMAALVCPHYLKIPASDQPGVFAAVAEVLGRHRISIEAAIQRPQASRGDADLRVPIIILTNAVADGRMQAATRQLACLDGVMGPIRHIRVADIES